MTVLALIAVAALALVAWTHVGYPLAIAALARFAPRPVRADARARPHVSIVLVSHDAAGQLAAKLVNLALLDYPEDRIERIVVSDGSRDATAEVLRHAAGPRTKTLLNPVRRGKSACLADAVAVASNEIIVFTDVRQPLEPDALAALVAPFADPEVGAVSGSLELATGAGGHAESAGAYWRFERWLRRCESRSGSVVGVTGALWAARRALLPPIPPGLVLDDVYLPMAIAMRGARVVFAPGAVVRDAALKDAAREAARKRRTLAGNFQLVARMPALLDPRRNPLWGRFVSHKLLRLATPWLLVVALVASVPLAAASPAWLGLLGAQLAGYALAALGLALPATRRVPPVRLAATFVELNLCAALALFDWLRARDLHLWTATAPAAEMPR